MPFRAATCPSCHQDIQVPDNVASVLCMFCGERILLDGPASPIPASNIANLLGMARTADVAGNMKEAGSYYNRVLEVDPSVSEAWFGKGRCAGWQSTMASMRFNEMEVAFGHAIGTVATAQREETTQKCVHEINRLVATLYGMARKHLNEYVSLPKTWQSYLEQTGAMLNALEAVRQWAPLDRTTLENIVHLSKENIEGIKFNDKFDSNKSKAWHLSPDYQLVMQKKLQSAADSLREIDENYVQPTPEKKKPDACFVITATMGDFDHPYVTLMRKFRDDWIAKTKKGRQFIDWYYCYGPVAARFISRSKSRRRISYYCVVLPAVWIARRFLK